MLTRFRARAMGGLAPREVDRRFDAVLNPKPARELPPPMPHPSLTIVSAPTPEPVEAQAEAGPTTEGAVGSADTSEGATAGRVSALATGGEAQGHVGPRADDPPEADFRRRFEPDYPEIEIIIRAKNRSGKSVLSHFLISQFSREGIAVEPPEGLRSIPWAGRDGALANLIRRGLKIWIKEDIDG